MATWFLLFCVFAVKHDCVFGEDLDLGEITYVSDVHLSLSLTLRYSFCFLWTELKDMKCNHAAFEGT